ncbi:hypothetical protein BDV19DRAFT_380822 [Aspergillus venezuelensis]
MFCLDTHCGHAICYSEWFISSENQCDLGPIKKASPKRVYIGLSQPATARLSECLSECPGYEDLLGSTGNILELRRTTVEDRVFYTGLWATSNDDRSFSSSIDLEKCTPAEAQWWAALLAPGCGWQAMLVRDGKRYYSPWKCHLIDTTFINLKHRASLPFSKDASSLSSSQAQAFLSNLARQYNCFDQLLAAFTATLTFPRHSRFGFPIILSGVLQPPATTPQDAEPYYENKLSSPGTSDFATSCLGSCIWDESVTSNLVSQWPHPLFNGIIPRLPKEHKVNTLLHIMAHRRPKLVSLCLGFAVSGSLPHIFQICHSHILPPSLEASTWTRSPHSFMDPEIQSPVNMRLVAGEELISREDELRLLWLTDVESETYGAPPLYRPAGFVTLLHAKCGHKVSYKSWKWLTKGGQGLSSKATQNIFTWTFFSDGARVEDREVWRHE